MFGSMYVDRERVREKIGDTEVEGGGYRGMRTERGPRGETTERLWEGQ